jgi:hypothetical protein
MVFTSLEGPQESQVRHYWHKPLRLGGTMTQPTATAFAHRDFLVLSGARPLADDPVASTATPTRRRMLARSAALLAAGPGMAAWGQGTAAAPDAWAGRAAASLDTQRLVRWSLATADHQGMPFAVIDKPAARIHVFQPGGGYVGSAPVLLGSALGDHSAPGIGQRPLSQIKPHERTTPAGRFVSEPGQNLQGDDIVWIDYQNAVSLHRVRGAPAERRVQRLASATLPDKRISHGCVNAPADFYNRAIAPRFGQAPGVVYVLPDSEPFATFFSAANAAYPTDGLL